jgi:peptide/nickel transport system ATP-binding protein
VPDAARPPLGCSFHPRCPNAFEVCGWETRDLRDLLENRWARLPEEQFVRERALVGNLDALGSAETSAVVPAGRGAGEGELLSLFERMREEDPDEPLWRGVRRIGAASGGGVEVEFHEPVDPRLLPSGDVLVECHLYDPDALAEAERRRS